MPRLAKIKKEKTEKDCSMAKISQLIGDVWVLLIVRELLNGPKRYNQLVTSLDVASGNHKVSSKTLCQRLKLLEEHKIISRKVFPETPVRVEYALTEKGLGLNEVIEKIHDYGEKIF